MALYPLLLRMVNLFKTELVEVGIKFQNDFLYASLSYYDQENLSVMTKLTPLLQYMVRVLSWK